MGRHGSCWVGASWSPHAPPKPWSISSGPAGQEQQSIITMERLALSFPSPGAGLRNLNHGQQGQQIKITSKNNPAASRGPALGLCMWACMPSHSGLCLGRHFRHSSPGMSYQVTHPGTQSTETIRGSAALSPRASQRGSPLIKGTRFTQSLQTSEDFLSQKKGPQEGHALQPHPVSQKRHLLTWSWSVR